MADTTAKDRILSWERSHITYPIGTRDTYLNDCEDWYSGKALKKTVLIDRKTGKNARTYPLAANYCQTIVNKLNSLIWGEWDTRRSHQLITWKVDPPVSKGWGEKTWVPRSEAIMELLDHVLFKYNSGNKLLYNCGLDSCIFGTGVLGIRYDPIDQEIIIDPIPAKQFHCIYRSDGTIAEAIVIEEIPALEAREQYGKTPNVVSQVASMLSGNAYSVERCTHWTDDSLTILVNNSVVQQSPNPYSWIDGYGNYKRGIVPFIVFANKPTAGDFYGYSDMDPVKDLVEELNLAMAWMGDIVRENAKPIRVLKNVRGDDEKYKLGPDRTLRINATPGVDVDAFLLTYEGGLPTAHQYLADLHTVLEDTGYVPAVGYGRYKGTQGSSLMLQVELMPALQIAVWKRLIINDAMRRMGNMITEIACIPGELGPRTVGGMQLSMDRKDISKHTIDVIFAPMLPRDDTANTNKQISLKGAGLRSTIVALEELDVPDAAEEQMRIEKEQRKAQAQIKAQQMVSAETQEREEVQKEAKGQYVEPTQKPKPTE